MTSKTRFQHSITTIIEFDEEETRAMEALAGYGTDAFIKCFYEHMGKAYLGPHEAGLRRILDAFYTDVKQQLHKIDKAKEILRP